MKKPWESMNPRTTDMLVRPWSSGPRININSLVWGAASRNGVRLLRLSEQAQVCRLGQPDRLVRPGMTIASKRALTVRCVSDRAGLVMPSTPVVFPQVVSRIFVSFHVLRFGIFAVQRDAQELHIYVEVFYLLDGKQTSTRFEDLDGLECYWSENVKCLETSVTNEMNPRTSASTGAVAVAAKSRSNDSAGC